MGFHHFSDIAFEVTSFHLRSLLCFNSSTVYINSSRREGLLEYTPLYVICDACQNRNRLRQDAFQVHNIRWCTRISGKINRKRPRAQPQYFCKNYEASIFDSEAAKEMIMERSSYTALLPLMIIFYHRT